jgi:GntR family transcriptional repressor for pyruvate dehydrogenase complex
MIEDPEAFVRADMAIHNCIAQASANSILATFMNSIHHVSEYSRRRTVEIEGVPQSTIDSHRKLVKAIQKRDPEAAARAMREHLDYVEKRLQESGLDHQEVRPNE